MDTLLYCTGTDLKDKQRYTDLLLAKHVDAILLVGSAFQSRRTTPY
jgi:LacI family transcriptional regulator/LacI family asc operon transcriptional repressor